MTYQDYFDVANALKLEADAAWKLIREAEAYFVKKSCEASQALYKAEKIKSKILGTDAKKKAEKLADKTAKATLEKAQSDYAAYLANKNKN